MKKGAIIWKSYSKGREREADKRCDKCMEKMQNTNSDEIREFYEEKLLIADKINRR